MQLLQIRSVALAIRIRRDFLFCQKRKLPPAGQALTPQTTKEPTQSPRTKNKKHKTQPSNRKKRIRTPAHRQARPTPSTDKAVDLQRGK
jgi:hypothetical protein